jgi:hypothetical protein
MIPKYAWLFILAACLQKAGAEDIAGFPAPGEKKLIHFDQALPRVANAARGIDYSFDLAKESFEIFVPRNYSDKEAFGVFAFMDSGDNMTMPKEWAAIMEREKLICLIPQKIGNNQPFSRRVGLTLIGILKTIERYKADPPADLYRRNVGRGALLTATGLPAQRRDCREYFNLWSQFLRAGAQGQSGWQFGLWRLAGAS